MRVDSRTAQYSPMRAGMSPQPQIDEVPITHVNPNDQESEYQSSKSPSERPLPVLHQSGSVFTENM